MLLLIVVLLNLFAMWYGIYQLVKKIMTGNKRPVWIIASGMLLFVLISICYYPLLLTGKSFEGLIACLTIVNSIWIYLVKKHLFYTWPQNLYSKPGRSTTILLIGVAILTVYFVFHADKYGSWDAIAIWNLHAKLAYYPGIFQTLYKSGEGAYSHLDYPLMLPSAIAFLWHTIGKLSTEVPLMISYMLLVTLPLLVYYALKDVGAPLSAYLSLLIFVIDGNFKMIAVSQCADTVLSALILLTFIQYHDLKSSGADQTWLLGFTSAACGWVKNDGLLFCLVFTAFFMITNYKKGKVLYRYLAGLAFPLLVVISFKVHFAPANDLISASNGQLTSLASVLTDTSRYLLILKYFISTIITNYPYALLVSCALLIHRRRAFLTTPFAVIGVTMAGFFAIYLISPHDLNWHLYTSLYRVYQQVYPSLIFFLLLSFDASDGKLNASKV